MTRLPLAACLPLLGLLLAGPALAQGGNAGGMDPSTPLPAPGVAPPRITNDTDRIFAREAAIGGLAEVRFAELADPAAASDLVKRFADRMKADHGRANQQLADLAAGGHLMLPTDLDAEHAAVLAKLKTLKGEDFDRAYLDSQLQDHQRTVQLLELEIDGGQDPALQGFAAGVLPVVLQHLQMAQDLATQLLHRAPQGSAPGMAMQDATP
jgi:putative membrane protein